MSKVLIAGSNSAIAQEFARRCAARGDRLFLIARDPLRLESLVRELGSSVAGSIAADLTDTAGNEARIHDGIQALEGLDVALIAHGFLGDQVQTEHTYAEAEAVLATNFLSAVSLVIPLANHFEAHRAGKLMVITSVAGNHGRPRNYTYGAAKGALNLYLQGVRSRLYRTGVKIFSIRLGPVETPMTVDHPKNALFAQPGPIADQMLSALEGRREDLYLPWYWGPIMAVVRNLPEPLFQRFGFLSGR